MYGSGESKKGIHESRHYRPPTVMHSKKNKKNPTAANWLLAASNRNVDKRTYKHSAKTIESIV